MVAMAAKYSSSSVFIPSCESPNLFAEKCQMTDWTNLHFITWEDASLMWLGTFQSLHNSTMKICSGLCQEPFC